VVAVADSGALAGSGAGVASVDVAAGWVLAAATGATTGATTGSTTGAGGTVSNVGVGATPSSPGWGASGIGA
jgi:hypothetical protein